MRKLIIAVDFDNTIALDSDIKKIGRPNKKLINKLIQLKNQGQKLILWTCRNGKVLDEAVKWCSEQGLEFDAVNENLPQVSKTWGRNLSNKIYADLYVDDRNISIEDFITKSFLGSTNKEN